MEGVFIPHHPYKHPFIEPFLMRKPPFGFRSNSRGSAIRVRRLCAKVKFLLRSSGRVDKLKEIVYNKSYLADVGPVLVEDF